EGEGMQLGSHRVSEGNPGGRAPCRSERDVSRSPRVDSSTFYLLLSSESRSHAYLGHTLWADKQTERFERRAAVPLSARFWKADVCF
ncbi:Uncharacterized protein DAT39_015506, partial [Clarias magur]